MQRLLPERPCAPAADRRGSATVELALVMPIFIALVLGVTQNGFNIDAAHKLYATIRQAGRLASQDYTDKLLTGQTGNSKVIQDIKNQLKAEGINGDKATVTITHADGASEGSTFDLSDADNNLQLFRIKVEIPYSDLNTNNLFPDSYDKFTASIVFRKGKNTLVN